MAIGVLENRDFDKLQEINNLYAAGYPGTLGTLGISQSLGIVAFIAYK